MAKATIKTNFASIITTTFTPDNEYKQSAKHRFSEYFSDEGDLKKIKYYQPLHHHYNNIHQHKPYKYIQNYKKINHQEEDYYGLN